MKRIEIAVRWREATGRLALYLVGMLLAVLVLNGCSVTRIPIPLIGTRTDITTLEGEWYGSYSSRDTGRSGSIIFVLTADADTASGDVVMYPLGYEDWYGTEDRYGTLDQQTPHQLRIAFVQVRKGRVVGVLEPYREPDCGCELHTVFEGRVQGNTIEGTFTARGMELSITQSGHWRLTRKRTTSGE